jgi:hypothetical protein
MRRLYVCPKEVWFAHRQLFHPVIGHHFIDLPQGFVLLACDFANEAAEDIWHGHPEVAPLPHPVYEGKITLQQLKANPMAKYKEAHHAALAAIGTLPTDTVIEVSAKASAIMPLVKIRHIT